MDEVVCVLVFFDDEVYLIASDSMELATLISL